MYVDSRNIATILSLILLLIWTGPEEVAAQQRFRFDPGLEYDASIPSPQQFLGYEPGDQFTLHADVVAYFKRLDMLSDRITLHKYGETYEGRGLYYAVISSEKNQSLIDHHRNNSLRLAHPDSLNETAADLLISNQPVTVWLSFNVHGNEASSSEAAMQAAYRLVAAEDTETEGFREQAITIIDPMLNPDGRDRYVFWYKSAKSHQLNTDPYDFEHDEIWPGGRTNHYWFDLNRDWVWLVHPESQGRIAAYQRWMPQVHLDLHEQSFNDNYFTMPGITPRNHQLPDTYRKWADTFGRGVIAEFDRHQVNYATREAFDFFYPGYGSSYPSTMGAIGMLAEQGGHSRGGRAVETEDGYVLTLRQRIFDHYTNSIATVRTAVENREGLLNYFRDAFLPGTKKGDIKAFILEDDAADYTYDVVEMLLKHGVEVRRARNNFEVRNAYSYWDGRSGRRNFSDGSFIIPADQPKHIFVQTLFKRQMTIEDSVMYDMSTWSVPLAYNLDAAWTQDDIAVESSRITRPPTRKSALRNADATYAYVVDWEQRHAPRALSALWKAGYRVRSAGRPFTYQGRSYSRGSLVVLIGRNYEKREKIEQEMRRIAREAGVLIDGFDTGRMDEGMDLASEDSRPVKQPKVALMVDSPFSAYTAGQIWYLFDRWTGFGISRLRSETLEYVDLNDYDVLILPGAWGNLSGTLDSTAQKRMKDWVREGGTLVATESSAEFLTKQRSGFSGVELFEEQEDEEPDTIDPAAYTPYEARADSAGLRRIPGAAFKSHIDNSHPLAFGLPRQLYSLKFSDESLRPDTDWMTVGYYMKEAEELMASGYASQENLEKISANAFAGTARMGSGKVVFLLDNTQYRMFWLGPARLMQNAVMVMPGY
ncbi:MAG: M14 family metallopeptidase [Balneolaceae bacterium]|nr:M14 family metallopeptidase [Balneolaceae bacterium]